MDFDKPLIMIPSRMESSRLPGKPLLDILGLPMVVHVAKRAGLAFGNEQVVVCTDSSEIIFTCENYNILTIYTKYHHKNGTERIAEAAEIIEAPDDQIIIDVQGDEPFVRPSYIQKVAEFTRENRFDCVVPHQGFEEYANENRVKIISSGNKVVYFSRADAPYNFSEPVKPLKKHLSIIGFKNSALKAYCNLEQGELEKLENVELMRYIEHGMSVGTFEIDGSSLSVDNHLDYEKAVRAMRTDELRKMYTT